MPTSQISKCPFGTLNPEINFKKKTLGRATYPPRVVPWPPSLLLCCSPMGSPPWVALVTPLGEPASRGPAFSAPRAHMHCDFSRSLPGEKWNLPALSSRRAEGRDGSTMSIRAPRCQGMRVHGSLKWVWRCRVGPLRYSFCHSAHSDEVGAGRENRGSPQWRGRHLKSGWKQGRMQPQLPL